MLRPHRGKRRWSLAAANKQTACNSGLHLSNFFDCSHPLAVCGILHASASLGNTRNLRILKNFEFFKNSLQAEFFKDSPRTRRFGSAFLEFVFASGWAGPANTPHIWDRLSEKPYTPQVLGHFLNPPMGVAARGGWLSMRAGARDPNFKSSFPGLRARLLKTHPLQRRPQGRRASQKPATAKPTAARANSPSSRPHGQRHSLWSSGRAGWSALVSGAAAA